MKFFNNLFKGNPRTNKSKEGQEREQSKFMPKVKVAIEERFIVNFIDNGGKFLYSENYNELNENLSLILKENNWIKEDLLIINNKIKSNYKLPNSIKVNQENPKCFVTDCENLIANDGSVLISSNQIEEKNLSGFPNNLIILSDTKKFKNNIGEGLAEIKSKSKKIPSNITTIKNFHSSQEKGFLSYGTNAKNLYLILLEKGTI
ncbi:MAG: lactate utilization protein B/C [Flavobacteriaceae bacterium]|nr:lactate utilization protein B/C [Flavobacteriaceae bacterium]MBT4113864.1 lactate utilization protein B/C [Flavobacteriaceae bacterium]MBT4613777.1 lactate utilization protein B/C [Flavobacteriaceae bacterium]MBT5246357.1 lactate utilization protein B/C [Flavobacteriaceae bacterium]MBT5650410.1 lactate utilization protein B/C [Flavobacteriaceae bacterium]